MEIERGGHRHLANPKNTPVATPLLGWSERSTLSYQLESDVDIPHAEIARLFSILLQPSSANSS